MGPVPELGGLPMFSKNSNSLVSLVLILTLVSLGAIIIHNVDIISRLDSIESGLVVETPRLSDSNFTVEHSSLASNQQRILNEVLAINVFSQCVVDVNNIVDREIPIDSVGGFRRVSIVTMVCPQITQGVGPQ